MSEAQTTHSPGTIPNEGQSLWSGTKKPTDALTALLSGDETRPSSAPQPDLRNMSRRTTATHLLDTTLRQLLAA